MAQMTLFFNEEPEQGHTEFKTASKGRLPKDIWETVTAFSNAEGGTIVFGVDPEGGFSELSPKELDKIQQDIMSDLSSAYNIRINPTLQVTEGVVKVYIPAASAKNRPVYSTKRGLPQGAKIRVGSANIQLTDELARRFSVAATTGGAESMVFTRSYGEIFDNNKVKNYIHRINKLRNDVYANQTTDEILYKLQAIDTNGQPTLFGLLAFSRGRALQEIVAPTTNIAVTHYRGTGKVDELDVTSTFLDNREFDGSVTDQFEQAFRFIKSKLPMQGTIEGSGQRRDYLVIPEIALREALANAIVHRDYAATSSGIQIDIYADRIEFVNPGRSLVPINELDTTPSVTRNPLLMSYLKDSGFTEQRARGIRTIKLSLRKARLKEPVFENTYDSFKVTIFTSAFISEEDNQWLLQFTKYRLNNRQLTALTHLRHESNAGISNKEYRELSEMNQVGDDVRAKKELAKLVEHGLVKAKGEKKSRRYYLNQQILN